MLVFIASPPNDRKVNWSVDHVQGRQRQLDNTGGPSRARGSRGCISFTLRVNDARSTN